MTGRQRKYLRGLAHTLKPVIYIGKGGVSAEILKATESALDDHELIKIKFVENKAQKKRLANFICKETSSDLAGMIGHVAIVYRPSRQANKRKITLPPD
ncbi:MAG: ribosome assembly RNA-binding protein YhbY [Desulfobacterales bacterium]|nr:ribosome assembly RNA-binding protein YhbY [Desulfobacterales bacterium]MDJ0856439.1 ribosome assembly RNA-binding protein YhbY [Desulfobacterales bacterium]